MQLIKLSAIAATLLASSAFATAANIQPSQGWDVYRSGNAEGTQALSTQAYMGTAMGQSGQGQGWDLFRSGNAEGTQTLSTSAFMGTSSIDSDGRGHNLFRVGPDVRY